MTQMAYVKLLECVIPVHFKTSLYFQTMPESKLSSLKLYSLSGDPIWKAPVKRYLAFAWQNHLAKINLNAMVGKAASKIRLYIYVYINIHTNTYSNTHYSCRWQNRIDDLELLSSHKSGKKARKWFNHALAHAYCTSFATKKHWIFQNFAHRWEVHK